MQAWQNNGLHKIGRLAHRQGEDVDDSQVNVQDGRKLKEVGDV